MIRDHYVCFHLNAKITDNKTACNGAAVTSLPIKRRYILCGLDLKLIADTLRFVLVVSTLNGNTESEIHNI